MGKISGLPSLYEPILMARPRKLNLTTGQPYPRILDRESDYFGCLDDSTLVQHSDTIPKSRLNELIRTAVEDADRKSRRNSLSLDADASPAEIQQKYRAAGRGLLRYLAKYCIDPAATPHDMEGQHYTEVARDLFSRRTTQQQRMNVGWRYQYLALYAARETQRFVSVSDIGTQEADFNAVVEFAPGHRGHLNLFVSIKNRRNTVGGQDFPKAVRAMERIASTDKNIQGPYLCVFGMSMDKGTRHIRRDKEGKAYSENTEIWYSDYFWPFFTNYTYTDLMNLVSDELRVLYGYASATQVKVPPEVLQAFGDACTTEGLLDTDGIFFDANRIVNYITGFSAADGPDAGDSTDEE